MRKLKLGAQLNISFILVMLVPMAIATIFSIEYYSRKIRQEAAHTIASDLSMAHLLYQNLVSDMADLALSYSHKNILNFLIGYDLGIKIGKEWDRDARSDNIDMVTVVDENSRVLVRSHAPEKIGDVYPQMTYIQDALAGKATGGTEVLPLEFLKTEGFRIENNLFGPGLKIMTVTGAAPVYSRQGEKIVAVVIVRRILNNRNSAVMDPVRKHLNVNAALFEYTRLIASYTHQKSGMDLKAPAPDILRSVMEKDDFFQTLDIREGGSISACIPIRDFDNRPVGVLMVQTGVDSYIRTRRTAVFTLLGIFCTGMLLALIVKTIIVRRIVIPVDRLRQGAGLIGKGDYELRLEILSRDEIGELTGAFNRMAEDLHRYDRQVKAHSRELEMRVRERTTELQTANEQLVQANTLMEDTLERLNPGVSRLIKGNRQKLGLVHATELVADVCNYTKLNMILGETLMGEFMKKFFREGHKFIARYRGMFDKTVGDQIVAIFGTPKDLTPASPAHPFDAIACGLSLIAAADEINRLLQEAIQDNYTAISDRYQALSCEDREDIRIEDLRFCCRIGINTSNPVSDREIDRMRMVMMGAETCVDYTAQGGAIIYAFRLESTGIPGQIHIGENTRRAVDHIYQLEVMPSITLKGLGSQTRYRVAGYRSVFENIYPKTRFYHKYSGRIPKMISRMIRDITPGRIQIREVRKINEYMEVNIPYIEHIAGVYNLSLARALFSYATGRAIALEDERMEAMIFACLWHSATRMAEQVLDGVEIYLLQNHLPENIDMALVQTILADIERPVFATQEAEIIAVCSRFDHMVFDRTFLREREQETLPAKEVVSLIKIGGKFDGRLVDMLGEMMVARNLETGVPPEEDEPDSYSPVFEDVNSLAMAIEKSFSAQQRTELLRRLGNRTDYPDTETGH